MITGGSSGGSAAAVAAASAMFSLGTDTGGSIRIPASFCGVVGIKPTYGRVSKRGIIPLSWSMDHAGPLAKSVWDTAAVLEAIEGFDAGDPASAEVSSRSYTSAFSEQRIFDVKGLRVGVCPQYYAQLLQPEVEEAFKQVLNWFEACGADLRELSYPNRDAFSIGSLLTMAEAYTYHERNLETKGEKFGPSVRYRLEKGQYIPAPAYINAQRLREKDRRIWEQLYREIDVFLSPTVIMPAFPIGEKTVMFGSEAVNPRVNAVLMFLTSLGNFNGHPVISLPCGFSSGGLPIGFQIQGKPFAEATVFQVAYAYEKAHLETAKRKCALWK